MELNSSVLIIETRKTSLLCRFKKENDCYGLDMKYPLKRSCWRLGSQIVVLLRNCASIEGGVQMEVVGFLERPYAGIIKEQSLPLSLIPGHLRWAALLHYPLCTMIFSLTHRPRNMETSDHGLQLLKLWVKNKSFFPYAVYLSYFVIVTKSWLIQWFTSNQVKTCVLGLRI